MPDTMPNPFSSKSGKKIPWKQIIIIVAGVIVIGGIVFATAGNFSDSNENAGANNNASTPEENKNSYDATATTKKAECKFPVTSYTAFAASYGVPENWIVEEANGTLAIMEDDSNLVTAFIYTAKLEQDMSASEFLDVFGGVFQATIEDAGGSFALGEISTKENTASSDAGATVAEGDLRGVFTTKKEGEFITFTAYWSPIAEFAAKEATLKAILDCYSRTTILTDADLAGAAEAAKIQQPLSGARTPQPWGDLVSKTDGNFSFEAPENWTSNVSSASESTGLTLDSPESDASVAFLYNLGRYGVVSKQEFAQNTMLITYGISATLSNHQSVDNADLWDFEGTFAGKSVRGAVAVRIEEYQTFFAHYLGVQIANADLWTTYAPTLNAIQASIRLTDAGQQLASLPAQPNYDTEALFGTEAGSSVTSGQKYKQEVDDKSADNWSDAMRGYDTMESPSTGQTYDVPLNAYNPTGPNGGGYYRELPGGGLEQLTPVQ